MILDPKQDVYQPTKYNNIISKMVWFITLTLYLHSMSLRMTVCNLMLVAKVIYSKFQSPFRSLPHAVGHLSLIWFAGICTWFPLVMQPKS